MKWLLMLTMTPSLVTSSRTLNHLQLPCRAGCFKGYSGFQLIPVTPVWALCQICCTQLWVKKYALPGVLICHSPPRYLWVSPVSTVPALHLLFLPLPKLLAPCGLPCHSPSLQFPVLLHLHPFFLFLWSPTPLPTFPGFHVCSACPACLFLFGVFFLSSSPFHMSPHPRIPYFPCLARLLILFLIPVSVQVCKAISDGEQGFIVGSVGQYKV